MLLYISLLSGILAAINVVFYKSLYKTFDIYEMLFLVHVVLSLFYLALLYFKIDITNLTRKCMSNPNECRNIFILCAFVFTSICLNAHITSNYDISISYPLRTIFTLSFVTIAGYIYFKEQLFWNHLLGISFLIIAIILIYLKKKDQ
jgi:multidrug transporter EmrE-like cation transporter